MFGEVGVADDKQVSSSGHLIDPLSSDDSNKLFDSTQREQKLIRTGKFGEDHDEMDMFGEVDDLGDNQVSMGDGLKQMHDPGVPDSTNQVPEKKDEEDDEMDMFGESGDGEWGDDVQVETSSLGANGNEGMPEQNGDHGSGVNDGISGDCNMASKPTGSNMEHIGDGAKEAPTMLDSGLGFCLDYSPDTPICTSDDKRPTSNAHDPKPHQEDLAFDNFPDPLVIDGAIDNRNESNQGHADDPKPCTQTPQEIQQEDDEMDMFGNSSDEEDSSMNIPLSIRSQLEQNAPAGHQEVESGAPMTAADALAAARRRASSIKVTTKQVPAKRAKIAVQQHQARMLPEKIPQYDLSERSYYSPVHHDKYWCELRTPRGTP